MQDLSGVKARGVCACAREHFHAKACFLGLWQMFLLLSARLFWPELYGNSFRDDILNKWKSVNDS